MAGIHWITLIVGILIGVFVWPMVAGMIGMGR